MGSAVPDVSSQKAVEPGLIDVGKKLLRRPSAADELLILLEKAESLLAKVWQQPPRSTCEALLPIMKALIKDGLLSHDDVNVQVALASCFNELTRITAPEFPYNDDKMRVIFQLFMVAFEHLSGDSGCNYYRALQIVETMAKVRSSLMLLDVDNDNLVVEMFRLFLRNTRVNHPSDIFKYKEMIMTLIIEEIDEISFELLRPLLASVKMRNKDAKPITWVLGTKVFENCAIKLQRCLREAVKAMNLELDDYAEIVASICHDTFKEKYVVSKKVDLTAGDADCAPQTNEVIETNLVDENPGALRKRRNRKLNSVIRSDEGYEHTRKRGGRFSNEASPDGYNEKEDMTLPSDLGNSSMLSNSSQKKSEFLNEVSLHKKVQSKKNQQNDLQLSSKLKRKILNSKEKDYNAPKKTGKKATAGASDIRMEKKEGILGDTSKEAKRELSRQEPNRKKEIISQKYEREDDADKIEDFSASRPAKTKPQGKEKETEKKSRRSWSGNGEELVNLRIQVWWPKDKEFYPGTIKAFDSETKKHTILYDDDEIEILNLRKETWKRLSDEEPHQNLEADPSSPPREPIKNKEKNAKRKAATLKKNNTASSSKRLKDENRSISKSGDVSSLVSARVVDGSEDAESNDTLQDATKGQILNAGFE
ncbi:hypothetical protein ACS0TY_035000 [Phlomoides rotata]